MRWFSKNLHWFLSVMSLKLTTYFLHFSLLYFFLFITLLGISLQFFGSKLQTEELFCVIGVKEEQTLHINKKAWMTNFQGYVNYAFLSTDTDNQYISASYG